MSAHFADELLERIRDKNAPACVGFDPLIQRLPKAICEEFGTDAARDHEDWSAADSETIAAALLSFGRGVIEAIAPHVPAIKINIAFFEPYYAQGIRVYYQLVHHAREAGLIVIGDVKRADIGHSTVQYANAQLGGEEISESDGLSVPNAVTVNPYFGFDAIRPFVEVAERCGRGLFVLVQTSNESANEVQELSLSDGTTVSQQVGKLVQGWACDRHRLGSSGYSFIGAVVSPRDLEATQLIRTLMPNCLFLVPGFGAQGRTAEQVATCFKEDGTGAIVSASRSVIYAYENVRYRESCDGDWRNCVGKAAQDLAASIRDVLAN